MVQWKDFVGGPIWWRNKSKMADGRHLGFRFWAIISASINIFAPILRRDRKSAVRGVPVLKNQIFFNCWSQRLRVFSVSSIAGSSILWMMNDPKRGRGQGHVTYFWSNWTDSRVPKNVFLVVYHHLWIKDSQIKLPRLPLRQIVLF